MENNLQKWMRRLQSILSASYSEKFVCFVDVLGYSNQSENSRTPSDIALPNLFINQMKDANNDYGKNLSIALFSDCAYIVADEKDIDALLDYVSTLTLQLLTHAIASEDSKYRHALLRGGITFGNVFCDSETNFVAGPAVVRAYKLEEKAVFPKVVVDNRASEKLKKLLSKFHIVYDDIICEESDGNLYLDFLNKIKDRAKVSNESLADTFKWVKEREKDATCENVQKKYCWMRRYLENVMK